MPEHVWGGVFAVLITVVPLDGQGHQGVDLYFNQKFDTSISEHKLRSHGGDWDRARLSQSFGVGRTTLLEIYSPNGQRNNALPL